MGIFLSRILSSMQGFSIFKSEPVRVLLLGLDAAGKTTILYKIKLNEQVTTIPTIGFNVEEVSPAPGITFTVWDVGGQEKIRRLWQHYYRNSEGLIFVVDSADRARLEEAREELFGILQHPETLKGIPVVIFANKQDMPMAIKPSELAEKLRLRELRSNQWFVQATCATTGDGLYEGLDYLSREVKEFRKTNRATRY